MEAEQAYEAIAPVYDAYTSHHDYEDWVSSLLSALEQHGLQKGSLLDVGCGTGKSFLPLVDRGWRVMGCDISPAMLERARAKVDGSVSLEVADMRELPRFGAFDLVWAIDDAINYLLRVDELTAALTGMRDNLAPNGLLLFDANTLSTFRSSFSSTQAIERDGMRLTWRGQESSDIPAGATCEARFEIEGHEAPTHVHRQRHFPEQEVLAAIERAGLECLDVYGHGTDGIPRKPLDEATHTKAIFIASQGDRGRPRLPS